MFWQIAQSCHNNFSRFLLSEYGKDMKRGFLAILEGVMEEGWGHFAVKLREATSLSFVLESKNRANTRTHFHLPFASGPKTSFVEVVKRAPLKMVSKGCSVYWREGRR